MAFLISNSGWDLKKSLSLSQITCLTIFGVCLSTLIISFILLLIYKNTLKNMCLALSEAEKISRNSLQNRFRRLAEIMRLNPNETTKKNLRIWEIEYKVLIERKFCEQMKNIHNFFVDPHYSQPTLSNYRIAKKSLQELRIISQQIYFIWQEVDQVFAWERIERDARIQTRELFNEVKEQGLHALQEGQFQYDAELFELLTQQINKALNLIDQKLYEGNYPLAETYLLKTNQQMQNFITLLDLFPLANKLLNETFPRKISRFDEETEKTKNYDPDKVKEKQEVRILKNTFATYKTQILEALKNFDYSQASQKIILLSQLFQQFENKNLQEKAFRAFLTRNLYLLNNFVFGLDKELNFFLSHLAQMEPKNEFEIEKEAHLRDLKTKFAFYHQQWNDFFETLRLYLGQNPMSAEPLQMKLLNLLNDLNFLYNQLIEITRNLKIGLPAKLESEAEFLTLDATLNSIQVLIEQYFAFDFQMTEKAVQDLRLRLAKLRQNEIALGASITNSEKQSFKQQINELILEALNIKNNLKNRIMIQILTENSIIYLERFSDRPHFQEVIAQIWELYEAQKFNEALNLTITQLQQYSLQKGDIWNIS
ncbi:hypothetical protein JN01_0665 [Entomoplasma freundtii]|uniref:Uncharacterized protein n=1 Tax=Entomoplasma freundtii TaxID=74700 RepID=A0A2K8NRM0_9MOLU|nr:hypothetical protein [Entomoplasma freundtii]ATZ16449.1 hypothetical protein EFREU_v1c04230 [Entomoplasma freundtii]TDY55979.1 hypothetical protein JN01_0665 [Entomoplasma freundtii]